VKRRYRTGDQIWVREHNLAIVLNYLWEAGQPVSRTQLVEVSGLNKSTVGSLLTQLQSWGFVRESGMTEPRPGRPGVLIDINPDLCARHFFVFFAQRLLLSLNVYRCRLSHFAFTWARHRITQPRFASPVLR
jgi:hypothetical protein